MLKRRIDVILSEGHGRQLFWLLILTLLCVLISIFIARVIFNDDILMWQDVVGLFLDPGVFGSFAYKGHDWFRLILALLSTFLFSALLVSVFTNVFENISDSVRNGHRRYNLKNHILILGGGHHLAGILDANKNSGKTVVVMSESKPNIEGDYIYYNGARDNIEQLQSANVSNASTIFVIGEDNEIGHDARNLQALDFLNHLCSNASDNIHCFVTVADYTTIEVFQYLKIKESSKLLLVDVLNDCDFEAEQLLVNTDFLPVIKSGEDKRSEIIIFGMGNVARAVAFTAAHISHYPNYTTNGKKTRITFIDNDMKQKMEEFISARPSLFDLSEYQYISSSGDIERHTPEGVYGDFLDIEWRFVDTYPSSKLTVELLKTSLDNKDFIVSLFVCYQDSKVAISTLIHLPMEVFGRNIGEGANNIAIYLKDNPSIINRANESGMYGHITIFGNEKLMLGSAMLNKRSRYGQRVNFVYDKAYGNPPSPNEEIAWYKIPEAHKYSSIYCANAMFLRRKCFDMKGDRTPIYEAEHRRWMMSVLLMGYSPGKKTYKTYYIHADIIPFDKLTKEEQEKDKILIDAMDEILSD